ncbi:hypothetical protein CSB11_02980 [Candidatus Campbellbacteria bacterium]|nr:MAG: hypothetical protein CSB11_02980 [Candidatus Campbellbacteria bacterium]
MTKIKKILSFMTVLLIMVATSVEARPVSNYYINGVDNTRDEAEYSAYVLQQNVSVGYVGYLYNQTFGFLKDVMEAAGQEWNFDDFYDEYGHVNTDNKSENVLYSYLVHPERTDRTDAVWAELSRNASEIMKNDGNVNNYFKYIDNYAHYNGLALNAALDLPEGIGLYDAIKFLSMSDIDQRKIVGMGAGYLFNNEFQYLFSTFSNEYLDINNMLAELYSTENEGKNINIIAHSQGNLFANRVLDAFGDISRVKLLSVSTPDNRIYGVPYYLNDDNYVMLEEDLVANVFRDSLPDNKTNYSDIGQEGVSEMNSFEIGRLNKEKYRYVDTNGNEKIDKWGHGFVSAYMHQDQNGPSVSKAFITSKFQSNYDELHASSNETYGTGGPGIEDEIENMHFNDFWVSNISLSKSQVSVGERFYVYVDQHYFGTREDRELSSARVGYFCSRDKKWDDNDYKLDYDFSSLGIDDPVHSEKERLEIPKGKCSSNGYILAVANYDDRLPEKDKSNNVAYVPLNIQSSGVSDNNDIYLGSTRIYDSSLYRGQEVKVRTKVCYRGNLTKRELGSVKTAYWLVGSSYAEVLETDTSTIGTDDRCDGESEYITIPENISKGNYYVTVVADYDKERNDVDVSNNIKSLLVYIR